MSALWTASELAAATGGEARCDFTASGVSIDSRSIQPGELFVALEGPNFDGHAFVAAALARGACGAVVARHPEGLATDAPLLLVGDTLAALNAMGRAARARTAAKIIGVTGSVGKTGTKEALRHVLSPQGATHASAGSLNNHWGVPLSLARMPRETRFGVFELGMNHAGELAELSPLVRPHLALITTIEPAHLGHFDSVEAIADAKAEIFSGVLPGGAAVLNRDNAYYTRLAAAARQAGIIRILGFGEAAEAEIRLLDYRPLGEGSAVKASVMGEVLDYRIAQPGRHWVTNSLAVLGAVKAIGGDAGAAAASLSRLAGLAGRGLRRSLPLGGGSFDLIDESYNASPASMRAAIAVLGAAAPGPQGRRIAVLGDMLELGDEAGRLHAELAQPLVAAGIDLVFTVGSDMARLRDALPARMRAHHAARAPEMIEPLRQALRPGDIVSIKGSAGSRMGEIVKSLTMTGSAAAPTAAAE